MVKSSTFRIAKVRTFFESRKKCFLHHVSTQGGALTLFDDPKS